MALSAYQAQKGPQMRQEATKFDDLADSAFVRLSTLIPDVIPASKSTLWRWVKAGYFPAPSKIADNTTAWRVRDVRAWLAKMT